MQSAARVLIVGHTENGDEDIAQAIEASGFESFTGNLSQSAAELAGQRRPDVVILNLNSAEGRKNPKAFFSLARTLKQSELSSRMRILLVGQNHNVSIEGVSSDIDDMLLGPVRSSQICHRLTALVRLNTMHEELVRRLNTSAKYGVDAPELIVPSNEVDNINVLFLGESMGFGAIETALSKKATIVGALSQGTAMDYLGRQEFDSILIDAGADPQPYLDFTSALRRNSRYFNLPVLMLADADKFRNLEEAYDAGVTDVLLKPASEEEIEVRTISLVREQRFRGSLRRIYSQAKHFATNDALTGLYARGFLFEHLTQVVADAQKTSQSFSLAAFDMQNLPEINAELGHASGDRLIRQVGELIGMLVRGEDLAARYSGKKFVVILPDTPSDQAGVAVHRINGVIHFTEFAIPDHHAPVRVSMHSNVIGYKEDDTAESMIERVWEF